MNEPPAELAGATLLFYTLASSNSDFGCVQELDTSQDTAITALAICRYLDEPEHICLFACDAEWNVTGDLLYDSIEEAKSDAERYYETRPLTWRRNELAT